MLNNLITKLHKTESKKLLCFRRSVIIVFLLMLILFFTVLIMKLTDEQPSMSSTFEKIDNLPVSGKNVFFFFELKKPKSKRFLISKLQIR